MRVETDFEEFLKSLNRHKVKYLIVGSFAVAFYARARYTKDMDILIEPNPENGKRIVKALAEFGFGSLNLTERDFCKKGNIIQLGYEPVRIDMLTSLEGCGFKRVWGNKETGRYGRQRVFFIGLEDLIRSKQRSSRRMDKIDLEILLRKKK